MNSRFIQISSSATTSTTTTTTTTKNKRGGACDTLNSLTRCCAQCKLWSVGCRLASPVRPFTAVGWTSKQTATWIVDVNHPVATDRRPGEAHPGITSPAACSRPATGRRDARPCILTTALTWWWWWWRRRPSWNRRRSFVRSFVREKSQGKGRSLGISPGFVIVRRPRRKQRAGGGDLIQHSTPLHAMLNGCAVPCRALPCRGVAWRVHFS